MKYAFVDWFKYFYINSYVSMWYHYERKKWCRIEKI